MACDYGYGALENELIKLLRSGRPDLDRAEELIRSGADLNAEGRDDSENVLSEILIGYPDPVERDDPDEFCDDRTEADSCEQDPAPDPEEGRAMCSIIRFFLEHGFDVKKNDGCFGAQCLYALTLSTFDRSMITATKMLLDAGAVNRTISSSSDSTPSDDMETECDYQDMSDGDHALANIYAAVCQIYSAVENGQPYSGIDSYEAAAGQTVHRVLALHDGNGPVFFRMNLPGFSKENCYTATLYFELDSGMLVTTQYADLWTDTAVPSGRLVDVSDRFPGIVGSKIRSFEFSDKVIKRASVQYCQPIAAIHMDSERTLRLSINLGEVKEEQRAAFYEIV